MQHCRIYAIGKQYDNLLQTILFDHFSFLQLSLDWLHSLPDEEVVEYLISSVDGLGRKSASCVMLLCMGRKDFPVDVNVARICARLGWVPLQVNLWAHTTYEFYVYLGSGFMCRLPWTQTRLLVYQLSAQYFCSSNFHKVMHSGIISWSGLECHHLF